MKIIKTMTLLVIVFATVALAQQKEPLTHETMWLMKRVGAPAPSPDGRWVVFSVTEPAYDEKDQVSDLWLVATDGSAAPRKITYTKASEGDVAWAPDSKRIAFTAKRDGDEMNQAYVLDIAMGGESQRLTNLSTGVRTIRWSPDGKTLAFTSHVYPGAADDEANKKLAKEEKDRKFKVRAYESFPIRSWDRWLDEKQVHLFVQPATAGSAAKDVLAGTNLVAEKGFGGTGGGEGRDNINAQWSPDGEWLVFAATTTRNQAAFAETQSDLYRVRVPQTSLSAGAQTEMSLPQPERIATGAGSHSDPDFSPDGKTLFVTFNPNNGKTYNNDRIVAFDWPSMQNRRVIVGPPFDRSVNSYAVSNDGKTIYFTAEDSGLEKVYAVPSRGGEPKVAVDQERGVYTDLETASDASSLVLVGRWGSSVNPAEIVRIDPATRKHRNLTDFNVARSAQLDWQPPRHFTFTSKRGRQLHNLLIVPERFDETKKYPLFVLIHGGAHSMWRDAISLRWNYHLLAKPGYVMLMTNYTGSTGFGEKFAQDIMGDPLRGPAEELNEAADEAIKRFAFIDASRQVAGGASYGGHLANALQAWSGTRYKTLISHAGLINLESQWGTSDTIFGRELAAGGPVWEQNAVWREQNPIRFAANFKTPMLLSIGEKDFRVPLNQTLENWSVLQRLRVPSRLLVWPEENHWILNGENSRVFYKEVADWLARWVQPGPK